MATSNRISGMLSNIQAKQSMNRSRLGRLAMMLILALGPGIAFAEITWNGDFSTGNFLQYHTSSDNKSVKFTAVPSYGRPLQYGNQIADHVGQGNLLSLVSVDGRTVGGVTYPKGPTRGSSPFAAKFTVMNSKSGSEPADCDPTPANTCERRRVVLKQQAMHPDWYNALPHMGERWVSVSMYVPADFPVMDGEGAQVFGIKMRSDSYAPHGYFNIVIERNVWRVRHSWQPDTDPVARPWQYNMLYTGDYDGKPYPRSDNWPEGLADFPDVQASQAALMSLNRGGWTDWILHFKQDHRGSDKGGTGFLTLWKREDSGSWTKVLHILPKQTTHGEMTFNHGIGYNLSGFSGNTAGSGTIIGMYGQKDAFWDKPNNSVLYFANHKIGGIDAKFSDMSPDGSSPESEPKSSKPMPPASIQVE